MNPYDKIQAAAAQLRKIANEAQTLHNERENAARCDFANHYVPNTHYPCSIAVRVVFDEGLGQPSVVTLFPTTPAIARAIHALVLTDIDEQLAAMAEQTTIATNAIPKPAQKAMESK